MTHLALKHLVLQLFRRPHALPLQLPIARLFWQLAFLVQLAPR
jgi:hypothetical protein